MPLVVTALVHHLRHELDTAPYPLGPRLDPSQSDPGEAGAAAPPPELPLRPGLAPTHGQKETAMGA
jgi:hypothetical protein